MPSIWTAETELKLLVVALENTNAKPDWATVATTLTASGDGKFTKESVRQHYALVAKRVKGTGEKSSTPVTPAAPSSGTKAAKAKAAATTPTKARKRKAVEPDTDDEEDFSKPVKAPKLEHGQKKELDSGNEDEDEENDDDDSSKAVKSEYADAENLYKA